MEKQNFPVVQGKETLLEYTKPFDFDDYDKKILLELNNDGRQSLADLSKKVGLSRDAIRNRIQKFIDKKVILSFKPVLNPPAMGFPIINYVFISLKNPNAEQEMKFIKYMKAQKNITYIASLIGKWDFIIDVIAENPGHFNDIMKRLRYDFADMIKDYEIYGVLEEQKYEEMARLIE